MNFADLKVYSPGYQAIEWGFDYPQLVDLDTALAQPTSIAVLPVFYDRPREFSYKPEFATLDVTKFDLVLLTEIELRSQTELIAWIHSKGISNWLLHFASLHRGETQHERAVYRPAWSFNFLRWNPQRDDFPTQRPYKFDCLCGARRLHRDFVMLALKHNNLLDQGIATYRDIFVGHSHSQTPKEVTDLFPGTELDWPYVSSNLDPEWEVQPKLDNSISGLVPWGIYNRTYFTILCETLSDGNVFLSAEKIGKCFQARRMFVHFGVSNFLSQLREFGFETFGSVIDESYDSISNRTARWAAAFEQVKYLCEQDLPSVLLKLKPVLDHNHHRLYQFEQEKKQEMANLVMNYLK